jgi:hypothetical protein
MNVIRNYFRKKKELRDRHTKLLESIEGNLHKLSKCIDTVDRYGSAIKTTSATRY